MSTYRIAISSPNAQLLGQPEEYWDRRDGTTTGAVKKRSWVWVAGLALALVPLVYFTPWRWATPLTVTLQEQAGQVRISWNVPTAALVTIIDGSEKISVSVGMQQSSILYARRSGDVRVQMGSAQARFIGPPVAPNQIELMRTSVKALQSQLASLRSAQISGWQTLAALEKLSQATH